MKSLKRKWNIASNSQFIIILLVFAINGSLSVILVKPLLKLIGVSPEATMPIIFWPIRILSMFIVYQVLLLVIGTLFGQGKFFWNMEKRMLSRIGFKNLLNKN